MNRSQNDNRYINENRSSKYLLSDYFLNEYLPLNPGYAKDDLIAEFSVYAEKVGLTVEAPELLFEAFTHKSFAHEIKGELTNNERLEFLGDSVLQLIVSEALIEMHPKAKEGELSKLRSSIVNEKTLSEVAVDLGLDRLIMLGKGELKEEGFRKPSLLSNSFEAYLGAVYLSRGFEETKKETLGIFDAFSKRGRDLFHMEAIESFDAKSRLQEELVKLYQEPPKYACEEVQGAKEKTFRIVVSVKDKELGELKHRSKKKGMQALAKKVLAEMKNESTEK